MGSPQRLMDWDGREVYGLPRWIEVVWGLKLGVPGKISKVNSDAFECGPNCGGLDEIIGCFRCLDILPIDVDDGQWFACQLSYATLVGFLLLTQQKRKVERRK